uniref:Uncharacterized protein n=1 Tax=Panagrolaimus sp. ES5 TaxID=591445 RepID=A0AC34GCH7_9BILA
MFYKLVLLLCCVAIVAADLNDDFKQCCKDKGINDKCAELCTYEDPATTGAPPSSFFLKLFHYQPKKSTALDGEGDVCGPEDGASIASCCQKGKDNRQCCTDAGVGAEHDFCVDICNGVSPPPFDDKYFVCDDMNS